MGCLHTFGHIESIQLELPEGTPQQLGFLYHMTYMTERELEHYKATVSEYRSSVDLNAITTSLKETERLNFIKPHKIGRDKNKSVFMGGFQQNAIVLAWEAYVGGKPYFFSMNDDYLGLENVFNQEYDSIVLHYTVDAHTTQRYTFYSDDFRYHVSRSNTKVPDNSEFITLADSLQHRFDMLHPEEPIILQPRAAAQRLLALGSGVVETMNDGERYCGQGEYKYGDVQKYQGVKVSYEELSYPDMFLARDILRHIDFSQYVYGTNEDDSKYFLPHKGRFKELCWRTTSGIHFLSGDLTMEGLQTLTFNVEADGLMRQRGLDGKFVVLQCNDWKYGMTNSELSKALNGDDKGFRKIKLAQVQGESPNMILGPTRTIKFPEGVLGVLRSYESLPESIFMEALRRSGR